MNGIDQFVEHYSDIIDSKDCGVFFFLLLLVLLIINLTAYYVDYTRLHTKVYSSVVGARDGNRTVAGCRGAHDYVEP